MKPQLHYATVTEAMEAMRKKGFELNFSLGEGKLICDDKKFDLQNFEIADIYRYEGNTDPGDEAIVYALQAKDGSEKGILVTGYGSSSGPGEYQALAKLEKAEGFNGV